MKKFLIIAGILLLVSVSNLVNVILTGSGISLVLGVFWLAASGYIYIQYRKMNHNTNKEAEQDAIQEEQA